MRARVLTWTLVIVLSMTLGGAAVIGLDELRSDGDTAVVTQAVPARSSDLGSTAAIGDLADLYAKVRPSVVLIEGRSSRTNSAAAGSGVVLDKQGHILTNNHVVRGFDVLDVTFAGGASYAARVVGTDPGNDIAVIRVEASENSLEPAVLGDSDKVRVGELVIAVGNPLTLQGSVSQGIVSGVGRTQSTTAGGRPLRQLIQSDAAINPGNSGGGLFNGRGELIGITTSIENPNGERAFVGIGYSVPINAARRFLPELLRGVAIQHPKMGVELTDLTPALAESLGLNTGRGVLIRSVESNSAASRAGLRGGVSTRAAGGDVIVSIDGKEINSFNDLASYIDSKKVGDRIDVKVIRDGRELSIELTLEAWQG